MGKRMTITLCACVLCFLALGPATAENVMLTTPGETVDDALQEAQQAVANSSMRISVSAVGFELGEGSEAEQYLEQITQIGGGQYYTAAESGELSNAMTAATTGQQTTYSKIPIINSPRNGDTVGPSTLVTGVAKPGSVVVIQTEVYNQSTGEFIKMVPGHRHATEPDGSFSLLIATPLVTIGEKDTPLRYEIHVFTVTRDGGKSPEAIVTVEQEKNTP